MNQENTTVVDGYVCPIDPMAEDGEFNCDSCQ